MCNSKFLRCKDLKERVKFYCKAKNGWWTIAGAFLDATCGIFAQYKAADDVVGLTQYKCSICQHLDIHMLGHDLTNKLLHVKKYIRFTRRNIQHAGAQSWEP